VKRAPKIRQADGKFDTVQELLFKQEVETMAAVSSPYIVKILGAFEDARNQYIVMEYCENGNLRDFLKRRETDGSPLSEEVYPCSFPLCDVLCSFPWIFCSPSVSGVLVDGIGTCSRSPGDSWSKHSSSGLETGEHFHGEGQSSENWCALVSRLFS
jgi:hypothetical protein